MKHVPLLLFLIFSAGLFAQEEGEKKKKERAENEAQDRLVLGFSFDNWIYDRSAMDSISTKWNSWGFNLYYMYDIPMGKSRFSFAPGIGFSFSWVKNNAGLDDTVDSLGTVLRPLKYEFKKNSLATSYFDIPLELRYRSKPNAKNKSFKMSAGVVGGVQMGNFTRTKTNDNALIPTGTTKVLKVARYEDLMRFRFGPTFRVGYGATNVFFYYSVLSLFKNERGPDIHPFSVGFSINGL